MLKGLYNKKNSGFTLAEVLITLGIIGVVAAMTIPGLITKYQKHVAATQLKKHYSQLNQVLLRISDDPGLDVLDAKATVFVPQYIQPHYAGSTYFKPNSDHKKTMCWNPENYYLGAKTQGSQYASIDKKGLSSGYIQTPFLSKQTASIMLQDGSCIGFNDKIINNTNRATIFVDINGSHVPPNRLGRDLFWFYVDQVKYTVVPTDAGGKYGVFDFPGLKIGVERIKNAGWTIPKDYPWK